MAPQTRIPVLPLLGNQLPPQLHSQPPLPLPLPTPPPTRTRSAHIEIQPPPPARLPRRLQHPRRSIAKSPLRRARCHIDEIRKVKVVVARCAETGEEIRASGGCEQGSWDAGVVLRWGRWSEEARLGGLGGVGGRGRSGEVEEEVGAFFAGGGAGVFAEGAGARGWWGAWWGTVEGGVEGVSWEVVIIVVVEGVRGRCGDC